MCANANFFSTFVSVSCELFGSVVLMGLDAALNGFGYIVDI